MRGKIGGDLIEPALDGLGWFAASFRDRPAFFSRLCRVSRPRRGHIPQPRAQPWVDEPTTVHSPERASLQSWLQTDASTGVAPFQMQR